MKIRLGSSIVAPSQMEKSGIERHIFNFVASKISESVTAEFSARQLKNLRQRIESLANMELMYATSVLRSAVDGTTNGLNTSMLMAGAKGYITPSNMAGGVTWAPLTFRYALHKERRHSGRYDRARTMKQKSAVARRASRYFWYNGRLKGYFTQYMPGILRDKMGGVRVTLNETGLKKRQVLWGENRSLHSELARITVTMLPNVSPSLLPMLSANTWDRVHSRRLENAYFPGRRSSDDEGRTAFKLTNPRGQFRPLVTPTLQFFLAVRIPGVVNREVQKFIRQAEIFDD